MKILGAEICAVHPRSFLIPGVPPVESCDRERSFEENLISFKPLVEACERFGVKLGIENLMKYPNPGLPPFYSYLVDHIKLIDSLNRRYGARLILIQYKSAKTKENTGAKHFSFAYAS